MARYQVTGHREVLGHRREDGIFEIELDPVTEARLIAGGHIERATRSGQVVDKSSDLSSEFTA